MRLAVCSLSAILLSGCSWLGGATKPDHTFQRGQSGYAHHSGYAAGNPAHMSSQMGQMRHDPCMVYSPVQPVPQGCDPAQVTLSTGYGQGGTYNSNYTTGGYGSHAGDATYAAHKASGPKLRKPKLRGSLSLGTEKSFSGNLLDFTQAGALVPGAVYVPSLYDEGFTEATPTEITSTRYTSAVEQVTSPTLSFDDVYNTPSIVKVGMEYIASPKFTVFASAGYAHAEGVDDASTSVQATLLREVSVQALDDTTGLPVGDPIENTTFIPNENVANFTYDFNDQRRFDLEVGARHYFNPISRERGYRTVTPFVGAAVGVSKVNEVSFTVNQNQRFLQRAFESGANDYYDIVAPSTANVLYEDDWLINGALTGGMEWQVTPGTALALETGLKYEQARDYANGISGDDNISVPVTLRGSFNF